MKSIYLCLLVALFISLSESSAKWEKVIFNPGGITLNDVCLLSENIAITVGESGVIRYTTDAGTNWTAVTLPEQINLYAVSIAELNNIIAVGNAGSIYESSDQGKTWQKYLEDKPSFSDNLTDIAFFDKDNGVIVGDNGIILITNSGGSNWSIANNTTKVNLKNVAYVNSKTIIAIGDGGTILCSTNSGADWTKKDSKTGADLKFVKAPSENHIYVIGDSLTVTISNDLGDTWQRNVLDTTNKGWKSPIVRGCVFMDSLFGIVRVDDLASASSIRSEISTTDGGQNWNYYNDVSIFGLKAIQPRVFEFWNRKFGYSAGVNGELFTVGISNANHFEYINKAKFSSYRFEKISTQGTSNILAIYNVGGILSVDAGKSWNQVSRFDTIGKSRGTPDFIAMTYPEENTIYLAMNNISGNNDFGYILKSTDKGDSWSEIVFPSRARLTDIIMQNASDGIATIAQHYFYRTHDGWATYDSVYIPNTTMGIFSTIYYPQKDYYIVCKTKKDNSLAVFTSSDAGTTWDSSFTNPEYCSTVRFFTTDKALAYGYYLDSLQNNYYDIIKSTTDKGITWKTVLNQLTKKGHLISKANLSNKLGFAGKSYSDGFGLISNYYITSDSGTNWKLDSLAGLQILEFFVDIAFLNDETMFAVGNWGSFFKYTGDITSVESFNSDNIDNNISISPNPATDYIDISVGAVGPSPLPQDIKIYNVLGDKVISVAVQNLEPRRINISSLPPGPYYYVISTGSNRITKNFVVVR